MNVARLWPAVVAAILLAGCGSAAPSAQTSPSTRHVPSKAGPAHPVTVPLAVWSCSSAAPPAAGLSHRIQRATQTMGQVTWEAIAQEQKGCLTLYRTSDGGQHWQRTGVVASSPDGVSGIDLLFIDRSHGWILAPGFPGAGQMPWALYHTTNGGGSWTHQPTASSSPFPSRNEPLEMAFESPRDGWLTGLSALYAPPEVVIYHTANGGDSWTLTSFSVPQKYASSVQYANPPAFTSGEDGTLTVDGTSGGRRTTLTYVTRDGGLHWTLQGANTN